MSHFSEVKSILSHYPLKDPKAELIKESKARGVWLVTSKKKKYILKNIPVEKTAFAIKLQYKLAKETDVPQIYVTEHDEKYVKGKNGYYYLTEFIKGTQPSPEERAKGLAKFHKKAKLPRSLQSYLSAHCKIKTPAKWLEEYRNKKRKFKNWQKSVKDDDLRKAFDRCREMAEKCIYFLKQSDIEQYIEDVKRLNYICHGDFHSANSIKKGGSVYIIDLDRAYVGPPANDFSFFVSRSLNSGELLPHKLPKIVDLYFQKCPEMRKYRNIYLISLLFPHTLHHQAHKIDKHGSWKDDKRKIMRLQRIEEEKFKVIKRSLENLS